MVLSSLVHIHKVEKRETKSEGEREREREKGESEQREELYHVSSLLFSFLLRFFPLTTWYSSALALYNHIQ